MAERLFLIDAHSHIYRSFYAIRNLSSPSGLPANAVYGFTTFLLKILREEKPDYIAVAFDEGEETFRHKQFAEYKARRQAMPEQLLAQLPWIRKIVPALGIATASAPGYEADDVIGTLALRAAKQNIDVFIATSDKDAHQLLGEHVFIYTKNYTIFDAQALANTRGIRPDQVVEVMGLSGDASDNVPGVRGVGDKTAEKLIHQFASIDNLYHHLHEVESEKLRQTLREHESSARLSRELVTLNTDAPLEITLEQLRPREPDKAKLCEIFSELGFRKLLHEFAPSPTSALITPTPTMHNPSSGTAATAVASKPEKPPLADFTTSVHLVNSAPALEDLAERLAALDGFAFDLETTSQNPLDAEIVGIAFSWTAGEGYYLPLMAPDRATTLPASDVLGRLKVIFENPNVAKWGQNLKYDLQVLRRTGIAVRNVAFDSMVASYLLRPERRRHNLDDLCEAFLGLRKIPTSSLIGTGRDQITMDRIDVHSVARYACEDVDAVVRLRNVLLPQLREQASEELFRNVEMPLIEVLAEMEFTGIRIDPDILHKMSQHLAKELDALADEIYEDAGERFNLDSPKQLQRILFDKWNLHPISRTKTGFSTNAAVLEELAVLDPRAAKIIHYRQLTKLKSTYLDALPKLIHPRTGRIHTSFNQTITATGRLSSSEPNLQNIPVRTDIGRKIRAAFVPCCPDSILLTADYSQIELRIVAHLSQDPLLVQAFMDDRDIHSFVASQVFNEPIEAVSPEHRRVAKAVNFGIIYGQTPFGLARQLGIPNGAAKNYIDSYFRRYAKVREFIARTIDQARRLGYVSTLLGRRRPVPEINSSNATRRSLAERIAVNTVAQGTAADMIKVAMVRIFHRIQRERRPSKLLLQIHDELVFEIPRSAVAHEQDMIRHEMVHALPLSVPVKVDIAIGENWLEAGEKK